MSIANVTVPADPLCTGKPDHPGTDGRYVGGCRCVPCTQAHNAAGRRRRYKVRLRRYREKAAELEAELGLKPGEPV